ncbi:retron Ec78 anti-phage system effector HNH endonuclease PtuB [Shewanella algae]|uniref:retron Ec78 anti-phage system effector HNH endonuclease PtuB n=1 Tax=Shewanella algae TaxID=38313 RepID=UPI0031F48CA3
MKKIIKSVEPQCLTDYRAKYPKDDWKKGFSQNAGRDGISAVRNSLLKEQGGLCVYCEIDLKISEDANNDFRVEHFYPDKPEAKALRVGDVVNYSLHWDNLFGCCHGGSVSTVVDNEDRCNPPDYHCDIYKANNDWTDFLLNPLVDIPSFPAVFTFNEDGNIFVNEELDDTLKDRAARTIESLKLDSDTLNRLRKAVISKLNEELLEMQNEGGELDDSLVFLAETYLSKDEEGKYNSPFFSAVRWYLGPDAETFLISVDY